MTLTPLFLTGFEHGSASIAGTGLFDVVSTGCTVVTTAPRHGTYHGHIISPGAAVCSFRKNFVSPPTKLAVRFGLAIKTLPTTGAGIGFLCGIGTGASTFWLGVDPNGVLSVGYGGTRTAGRSGPTISDTSYHLVELSVDVSANPWKLDWKIDGAAQTQYTQALAAGTITYALLGEWYATSAPAYTADVDDWITGSYTSATAEWWGDGDIELLAPTGDGVHTSTGTQIGMGDAGVGGYVTSATTTAYTKVTKAAPWSTTRDTTNNLSGLATSSGIAKIHATGLVGKTGRWLRAICALSNVSGTQSNALTVQARDSANAVTNVFTGSIGVATNIFKGAIIPPPVAGWTASEITSLLLEFLTGTDVSPVPTLQAWAIEVDYPSSVTLTLTATGGSAVATGDTANVALTSLAASGLAIAEGPAISKAFWAVQDVSGVATATGESATLVTVGPTNLVASAGTATASAVAIASSVTLIASTGTSSATGGTVLYFKGVGLTAATGLATATGPSATSSFYVQAVTGTSSAIGGTAAVAVPPIVATTGLSTASGTEQALTIDSSFTSGTSTAGGGTATFSSTAPLNLSATSGVATASGTTLAKSVQLLAAVGSAFTSGAVNTSTLVAAVTGIATASGVTVVKSVTMLASTGAATSSGGTANYYSGAQQYSFVASGGSSTASGNNTVATVRYSATSGSATAQGNSTVPTVVLSSVTGIASSSGGTANFTRTKDLTASTGNSVATGGTVTASFRVTASTGLSSAVGGYSIAYGGAQQIYLVASAGVATGQGMASTVSTSIAGSQGTASAQSTTVLLVVTFSGVGSTIVASGNPVTLTKYIELLASIGNANATSSAVGVSFGLLAAIGIGSASGGFAVEYSGNQQTFLFVSNGSASATGGEAGFAQWKFFTVTSGLADAQGVDVALAYTIPAVHGTSTATGGRVTFLHYIKQPILSANGEPVLVSNGEPILSRLQEPVLR